MNCCIRGNPDSTHVRFITSTVRNVQTSELGLVASIVDACGGWGGCGGDVIIVAVIVLVIIVVMAAVGCGCGGGGGGRSGDDCGGCGHRGLE